MSTLVEAAGPSWGCQVCSQSLQHSGVSRAVQLLPCKPNGALGKVCFKAKELIPPKAPVLAGRWERVAVLTAQPQAELEREGMALSRATSVCAWSLMAESRSCACPCFRQSVVVMVTPGWQAGTKTPQTWPPWTQALLSAMSSGGRNHYGKFVYHHRLLFWRVCFRYFTCLSITLLFKL